MASFVTPTELIVWMDIPHDTFPNDRATLLVDSVSAAIRGYCGWNITQEVVTGDVIDGSGGWDLWLPTMHLTAVASVEELGVALVDDTDFAWFRNGRLTRAGRWTSEAKGVTATYTHGYPAGHPRLELARSACLLAASRLVPNPAALRSYTVGGVSETYLQSATGDATILSGGEQAMLAPLALHGVS